MNFLLNEKTTFALAVLLVLVLYVAAVFYLIDSGFYAISADENGHTLEAYYWFLGDGSFFSIWLPFQKVIYGLAFRLHPDLFWTPRIISMIFGLFTLLFIILIAYSLFEERITAVLTGFFAVLFMPFITFTVLPLTEVYFFFFITSSVYFYIKFDRSGKYTYLWVSLSLSALATTVRYEAWVFAGIMLLMISFQIIKDWHRSKVKTAAFISAASLILFAFPLLWIVLSFMQSSDAGKFVYSVTDRYSPAGFLIEIKNNVIFQFFRLNSESLNVIGLIGLVSLFKSNRTVRRYSILFAGSLLVFGIISLLLKAMPTHNFWRIASIWAILLLPFTLHWLSDMLKRSTAEKSQFLGFMVFFLILIFFFTGQTGSRVSKSYISKDDLETGRYIRGILKENENRVYIQKDSLDRWKHTNILITSGSPEKFRVGENWKNAEEAGIRYFLLDADTSPADLRPGIIFLKGFAGYTLWQKK